MSTILREVHKTPGKVRSKIDIMTQVLQAANGGSTRTKIMYKTFLSHEQLKKYLVFLSERGLLVGHETGTFFRTTQKGLNFIAAYDALNELCELSSVVV
jgi:predicted transcriptional regulator